MNQFEINDLDSQKPSKSTTDEAVVEQTVLSETEIATDATTTVLGDGQQMAVAEVKKNAKKQSKSEKINDLLAQLHDLRVVMKEVVDRYQAVTSAQLSGLIMLLEDSQNSLRTSLKLKTRKLSSMSDKLCLIKLKPKKGRAKDLVRIEELIEDFISTLSESNP